MADTQENRLRQLLYAVTSGQVSAHKRRASGYSRKHRRGSDRAYTRHAWKAAQAANMKLKGFTPPENHYERVARSLMMGVAQSKRWKKYMRRADKARLDPSLAYDFKRAGRDSRFGLTIENEGQTMTKKIEEGHRWEMAKDYAKVVGAGIAADALLGTKGAMTATAAIVPVAAELTAKVKEIRQNRQNRAAKAKARFQESVTSEVKGQKYRQEVRSAERRSWGNTPSTPSDREEGTSSLTNHYKENTPGHGMKEETLQTVKNAILEAWNTRSAPKIGGGRKTASRGVRRAPKATSAGVPRPNANPARRGGKAPHSTPTPSPKENSRTTGLGAKRKMVQRMSRLVRRKTRDLATQAKSNALSANKPKLLR